MSRYNSDCKVYVGDLGNSASKQEIEDAFRYYGPLRNVWVARNPPGFAFVEFEDTRDAEDAVRGLGALSTAPVVEQVFYLNFVVQTAEPFVEDELEWKCPMESRAVDAEDLHHDLGGVLSIRMTVAMNVEIGGITRAIVENTEEAGVIGKSNSYLVVLTFFFYLVQG